MKDIRGKYGTRSNITYLVSLLKRNKYTESKFKRAVEAYLGPLKHL